MYILLGGEAVKGRGKVEGNERRPFFAPAPLKYFYVLENLCVCVERPVNQLALIQLVSICSRLYDFLGGKSTSPRKSAAQRTLTAIVFLESSVQKTGVAFVEYLLVATALCFPLCETSYCNWLHSSPSGQHSRDRRNCLCCTEPASMNLWLAQVMFLVSSRPSWGLEGKIWTFSYGHYGGFSSDLQFSKRSLSFHLFLKVSLKVLWGMKLQGKWTKFAGKGKGNVTLLGAANTERKGSLEEGQRFP